MTYPMGGTIDGARGDHVLLAPPFIISDDELDLVIERLVAAVDTATGGSQGRPGVSPERARLACRFAPGVTSSVPSSNPKTEEKVS